MSFNIFKIQSTFHDAQSGPEAFAGRTATGALTALIIKPLIFIVVGMAILFLLAWTHVLGGPYFFFKILFILALMPAFTFISIAWKLIALLRRPGKAAPTRPATEVRDVEFTIEEKE